MYIFVIEMKRLTFILGLFILLLSLNPCSDGLNEEHQEDNEISMNHNHQEDTDDSCPMTCACSCCGTTITFELLETFILQDYNKISTLVFSDYNSNYRYKILNKIWQPPQVIS